MYISIIIACSGKMMQTIDKILNLLALIEKLFIHVLLFFIQKKIGRLEKNKLACDSFRAAIASHSITLHLHTMLYTDILTNPKIHYLPSSKDIFKFIERVPQGFKTKNSKGRSYYNSSFPGLM